MRLEALRSAVLEANLELVRQGLVLFTFGNASGIDRHRGLVAIKPSGVDYEALAPADMVVTDLDGKVVEGGLRPSSDLATHLLLYKEFPASAGWSIRIRNMLRRGPRLGGRFPPTELPMRTTSTARFP